MSSQTLQNKVCLVTGALGLLGRQFCKTLSDSGATVVVADLNRDSCQTFANALGNGSQGFEIDVSDPASVSRAAGEVFKAYGHCDVLVNNAALNDKVETGTGLPRFENYPVELWNQSWQVNTTGIFLMCQNFGSAMAQRGAGSIVNIASTYGIVAPDQRLYDQGDGEQVFFKSISYTATKAAVIAMSKYLACHWGKAGVRVNSISPGGVKNGQDPAFIEKYANRTPMGRMLDVSELSEPLVFLASDASSYVTGHNLVVDGGWTAW